MANLKFEGNLNNISEVQQKYISKVLQERGYKNKNVLFSALGSVGDNYMANVRRITVENDDGTKFKMIAKMSVQDPLSRQMMGNEIAFCNESLIYTKVLPKFTEMEEAANIPENKRFKFPKCYGVCLEEPYEVILLEDLTESGYQVLDKFVPLSDDHVRLVLSSLARFHALSYAWKHEDLVTFDALKAKFRNPSDDFGNNIAIKEELFNPVEKEVLEWTDDDQIIFNKGLFFKLWEDLKALNQKDYDSKFSVLQHGDVWTNNIVFKSEESSPACILIDYQMVKPNKPASDILFFLLSSTIHELRSIHFEDWLQHYYDSLDTSLSYFGLTASKVLPRQQLDADIKEHADTSMRHVFFGLLMTLRDPSESLEMINEEINEAGTPVKRVDLLDVTQVTKDRLQDRARGMAKTLKQYNLV